MCHMFSGIPFLRQGKQNVFPTACCPQKKGMYVIGGSEGGNIHGCLRPLPPHLQHLYQTHLAEEGAPKLNSGYFD